MNRTPEAMIDADGKIRLLKPVQLSSKRRALVTILEEAAGQDSEANQPRNGEELVSYWKSEGLIGTRPDTTDSPKHSHQIRHKAERRR